MVDRQHSNQSNQSSSSSKKGNKRNRDRDSNGKPDSRERSPKRHYSQSKGHTQSSYQQSYKRGGGSSSYNKDRRDIKDDRNLPKPSTSSTVPSNLQLEVDEPAKQIDADDLHMMHNAWGHGRDAVWHLLHQVSSLASTVSPSDLVTVSVVPDYSATDSVSYNDSKTVRLYYMNNNLKGHDFSKSPAHRPMRESMIYLGPSKLSKDPVSGRVRRVDFEPRCTKDCHDTKETAMNYWSADEKMSSLATVFDVPLPDHLCTKVQMDMTLSNLPPTTAQPILDMIPFQAPMEVNNSTTIQPSPSEPSPIAVANNSAPARVEDDEYSDVSDHEYENQFASMHMEPVSSLTPETRVQKQAKLKQIASKNEVEVKQSDSSLILKGKLSRDDEPYSKFHHASVLNKVIRVPVTQPPLGMYPEDGLLGSTDKSVHGDRWRVNQRKPSELNRDNTFRTLVKEKMRTDPVSVYPSPQDIANLPRNDEKTVQSLEVGLEARLQRLNLEDLLAARMLIIHGSDIPVRVVNAMHSDIATFYMPNATLLQMVVAAKSISASMDSIIPKTLFIIDSWNIDRVLNIPDSVEKHELTEEKETKVISQLLYAAQVATDIMTDGLMGNFVMAVPPGLAYQSPQVQRLYAAFTIAARFQFMPVIHTGNTIKTDFDKAVVGSSGMLLAEALVYFTELADALPAEGGHPGFEIIVSKSLAIDMRDQINCWNKQFKTPKDVIQCHKFTGLPDLSKLTDFQSPDIEAFKPMKKLMDRIKRIELDDVTAQVSEDIPSKYIKERIPSSSNRTFSSGIRNPMGVYPEAQVEPTVNPVQAVGMQSLKNYISSLVTRLSCEDEVAAGIKYSKWQTIRNLPLAQLLNKYPIDNRVIINDVKWLIANLGNHWTVDACYQRYQISKDLCEKVFEILHENLTWIELAAMSMAFGEEAIANQDPIQLFGRTLQLITNSQMTTLMIVTNLHMPAIMKLAQLIGSTATWKHLKTKMNAIRRDLGTEDRSESGMMGIIENASDPNSGGRSDYKHFPPMGNSSPLQMAIRMGCSLWDLVNTFPEIVVNKVGYIYPLVMPEISLYQMARDTWVINDINFANSYLPNEKATLEIRLKTISNHAYFGPVMTSKDWANAEKAQIVTRSHKQFRLPAWWNCQHRVQQAWSKSYQKVPSPITPSFCELLNRAVEGMKLPEPPLSPSSVMSLMFVLSPWRSFDTQTAGIHEAKLFGPYSHAAYLFIKGKRRTYSQRCTVKRQNSGNPPILEPLARYWLARKESQPVKDDVNGGKNYKPRLVADDLEEIAQRKKKISQKSASQSIMNRASTPSRTTTPITSLPKVLHQGLTKGVSSKLQIDTALTDELDLSVSQSSTIDDGVTSSESLSLRKLKNCQQKSAVVVENKLLYFLNLNDLDDEEIEMLDKSKNAELVAPHGVSEPEATPQRLAQLASEVLSDPTISVEQFQDQQGLIQSLLLEQESMNSGENDVFSLDMLSSVSSNRMNDKCIAWDSESSEGSVEIDIMTCDPPASMPSSISSQSTEEEVREVVPGKGGLLGSASGQVPENEPVMTSSMQEMNNQGDDHTYSQISRAKSLPDLSGVAPEPLQMEPTQKFVGTKRVVIKLDRCFVPTSPPAVGICKVDPHDTSRGQVPPVLNLRVKPLQRVLHVTNPEKTTSGHETENQTEEPARQKLSPHSREREKKKRELTDIIAKSRDSSQSQSPAKSTSAIGTNVDKKTSKSKKLGRPHENARGSVLPTDPRERLMSLMGRESFEAKSKLSITGPSSQTSQSSIPPPAMFVHEPSNQPRGQRQPDAELEVASYVFSETNEDHFLETVLIEHYIKDRKAIKSYNDELEKVIVLNVTPPNTSAPGHIVGSREDPMGEIDPLFLPMCVGNEVKHTPQMILTLQCEDLYRRMYSSVYPYSPRFKHARQTQEFIYKYENEITEIKHEFERELLDPRLPLSQEYQELITRNPHVLHVTTFHMLLAAIGISMVGETTDPIVRQEGDEAEEAHLKLIRLAQKVSQESKTALMIVYSQDLRDWILEIIPIEWLDAACQVAEATGDSVAPLAFMILVETLPQAGLGVDKKLFLLPNFLETIRRGGLHNMRPQQLSEYSEILPDAINLAGLGNNTLEDEDEDDDNHDAERFIIHTGLSDQAYGRGMDEELFASWVKSEVLTNAAYATKDIDLEKRVCHAGEDSDEPWSEGEDCTTIHHVLFGKGTWDDSEDEYEKRLRKERERAGLASFEPEEGEVVSRSRALRVSRANLVGVCPLTKTEFQRSQNMVNELIRVHPNPHPMESLNNYFSLDENMGRNRYVLRWKQVLKDLIHSTKLPLKNLSFKEGDCITCTAPYEESDSEERPPCRRRCPNITVKKRTGTDIGTRLRDIFMMNGREVTREDLRDWHPAITKYSPQVTFGLLTLISSYNCVEEILKTHKLCFVATERWGAKLYDRGEKMKYIHKPLYKLSHIQHYARQGRTLTMQEATKNRVMEIPVKLAVADENGHPVILRDFHPTCAASMTLVPEVMWTGSMRGYSDIIEQCDLEVGLITPALRKMMSAPRTGDIDEMILKRDNGKKWINAGFTPYNSRIIQALNLMDPNLTGTGGTSTQQVKTAKLLRACFCLASELLRPDEPVFLVVWVLEDILALGMPAPAEKVIPFVLSNYLPVRYLYMVAKEKPERAGHDKKDIKPDMNLLKRAMLEEEVTWMNPDLAKLHLAWMEGPPSRLIALRQKKTAAEFRAYLLHEVWQIAREFHRNHIAVFDELQYTVPEKAWTELKRIHHDPYSTGTRPFVEGEPGQDPYRMTSKQYDSLIAQLVWYQLPRFVHPALCMNKLRKPPTYSVRKVPRWTLHRGREEHMNRRDALVNRIKIKYQKLPIPKNKHKTKTKRPFVMTPGEIKQIYDELYGENKMRLCPFIRIRKS